MSRSLTAANDYLEDVDGEPVDQIMTGLATAVAATMILRMDIRPATPRFDEAMDLFRKQIDVALTALWADLPSISH